MTVRQSIWFFAFSSIKTVDDHSGYALPFDPIQHITSNNAAYHDIHHQSWGIKTNFSQPFFTFWDTLLGTRYEGDVTLRYERGRRAAQEMLEQEKENVMAATSTGSAPAASPLAANEDVRSQSVSVPRITRKRVSSISHSPSGNLKGLTTKVNQNLHGKRGNRSEERRVGKECPV